MGENSGRQDLHERPEPDKERGISRIPPSRCETAIQGTQGFPSKKWQNGSLTAGEITATGTPRSHQT